MRSDHLERQPAQMPVNLRLPLAAASVAAALTLATVATGGEPSACTPAEKPNPGECDGVETFSADPFAKFNPNDTLHLVGSVATVENIAVSPLSGPIRFAAGASFLFGVAPLSTQTYRLSIGGTVLAGEWGRGGLGGGSVEPRVRASMNLATIVVLPFDVYIEGVAPYFPASNVVTGGFGVGGSLRALWFPVDLGVEYLFGNGDFGRADRPAAGAVRIFASVGLDFFAFFGVSQRPVPEQTRIDLRCDLLDQARRLVPPGVRPAFCSDVTRALDGAYADHQATAMARFLSLLPAELGATLTRLDTLYTNCVESERRIQRACVDCTGAWLSNWFSYTVDPQQIAAALGCVPGVNPSDAMCPEIDAQPARHYMDRCP